ncbi:MAG: NAD-dependent epimerase/dehydratase family protein [Myxococcota bacterium]
MTGASGLVGRQVVARLAAEDAHVVALDLREPAANDRLDGVCYETDDIREPGLEKHLEAHGVDTVVHLAAVVTPGPKSSRELEYEIDVVGTRNVALACVRAEAEQLVYTSSGAAYGYHADNPVPLRESDPLRGKEVFAYAWHKRRAEEILAEYRTTHPTLGQLVFRVGTILGERVRSPITALFERRLVVGVAGSDAPFVLIWDEDVAACIVKGIAERRRGVFNLTGDGALPLPEIARRLGKPYLPLPAPVLAAALGALHRLGLSARGAEQVDFLRYRPVLANDALKRDFGFTPRFTSSECFDHYRRLRFGG